MRKVYLRVFMISLLALLCSLVSELTFAQSQQLANATSSSSTSTLPSPHPLELAYWLSQVGVFLLQTGVLVVAIWAAVIGIRQLRLVRASAQDSARNARASFLIQFDSMFEADRFRQSRTRVAELGRQINSDISASDAAITKKSFGQHFADRLHQMRRENRAEYDSDSTFAICSLFETAGLLVQRGYVDRGHFVPL